MAVPAQDIYIERDKVVAELEEMVDLHIRQHVTPEHPRARVKLDTNFRVMFKITPSVIQELESRYQKAGWNAHVDKERDGRYLYLSQ
ncbi:hypothetical protein ACFL0V_02360 [Nanoarchaeota archaeon]